MRICTEIKINKSHYYIHYIAGLFLGLFAWHFSQLISSGIFMKFITGIGFFMLAIVITSFLSLNINCVNKTVPDGFSLKITTMAIKSSSKAALVLLGIITIAFLNWFLNSNIIALKTSWLGLILCSAFLYYWWVLHSMFHLAREKGL